jgi:hypothetical protein
VAKNAPRARELRDIAVSLPKSAWARYTFKEGSKGPMVAEFAFLRVTTVRDKLPGPRVWAVFRRSLEPQPEVKFYLSNAPLTCARYELAQLSGLRWPVETALEEGKGEVGMDHYETRSWRGWHHHMAHTFLAHLFLMRLRLVFKKTPALTTAQAHQLVAYVIRDEMDRLSDILAIIDYRQRQNYAAYRSHRKRTLRRRKRRSAARKP